MGLLDLFGVGLSALHKSERSAMAFRPPCLPRFSHKWPSLICALRAKWS